jgi:hypothetical protein
MKVGDLVRVHPKSLPGRLRDIEDPAGLIGVVIECTEPTIHHPTQIISVNFGEGIVEDYYSSQIELISESEE